MCGIVGCFGKQEANEIVLEGLRRLEYRGYDSCGISFVNDSGKIKVIKSTERISSLKEKVEEKSLISFGHTRWATHGVVNLENAHPHITEDGTISIVHNGVIENYQELKKEYCENKKFKSQTDTEVLLYVLEKFYLETKNMNTAITKFMKVVHGSYALIVYNRDEKNKVYAVKNKSPLLLGKGKDYYTLSSDPSAVCDEISEFYQFEDKCFLEINSNENSAVLFDEFENEKEINFENLNIEYEEISSQEYSTFMHKEIEEQPKALRNIVANYQTLGFDEKLKTTLKEAGRIYIVACGTSYNAGLICKDIIEDKLNIPTEVLISSEYGYQKNIIDEKGFFIFLSQSGETADSMLVFNKIKNKYPILAITNVRESQMDRNADFSLQIYAGVEVAVASTKAYTAQIAVLSSLIYETVGDKTIYENLLQIADAQEKIMKDITKIEEISKRIKKVREVFILGRLSDYSLAQEAALKIKEITYINVLAIASGELKHGTISLIDPTKLILSIITNSKIAENSRSNSEEVKARNGEIITFATNKTTNGFDDYVVEYNGPDALAGLVMIVPFQFLSLFTAQELNLDVDKPRNLAKAVTVE